MSTHPHQVLVKGDVVLIRAVVDFVCDDTGRVYAKVGGPYGASVSAACEHVSMEMFFLAPGDEVRAIEASPEMPSEICPFGIVAAVIGERAWIEWPHGPSIDRVETLERIRTAAQVAANAPRPGEEPVLPMAAE
ncbi:hypothetical protein [Methylobacterium sp. CG08_land_8_20_14_0_20_71_15]|uniref:Uncharacterized protein n=1 Tax=Methylobacterium jeotgali TaxID=381630 RepID=A0ABQ4SZS5_9HYPH|nr:hypothetical protein [Methylobacterium sp. CG08_land_8_20_14_0_20_71_15]PIU06947.1 MAG: hypothetical protein COT56_07400 [Methylobacterium sp. CG09_land_8_20_14_0_10_71_15]PIU16159.1 MAG: hypothetical protein COT28_01720 [Methylobacterium sp. CG08_land_8_20_14_0_20_71_15]GJE08672.1 hypothetical protein AOPFMNJM_4015 [Methylobacterium jeotgali]